jgi:hypothetical protein
MLIFVNDLKYSGCSYYPFLLSFEESETAFRFYNGDIVILVAVDMNQVYPVHAITRKSFGDITRKLSVTVLLYLSQCRGTLSRRKSKVASANSLQVA